MNYDLKPKAGRPRNAIPRKVFSCYGTEQERALIHCILLLAGNKVMTDDELKYAKKFFNKVKGRWSNV